MASVTLRPMSQDEYDAWQSRSLSEYAEEHVAAGTWTAEAALENARAQTQEVLPDGLQTDRMIFSVAVDDNGEVVGHLWLSLDHPRRAPDTAWIYDIEIVPARRGQGFGRALLAAAEAAVLDAGVPTLALNVFGRNAVAIELYESAGYETTTRQMRKSLSTNE